MESCDIYNTLDLGMRPTLKKPMWPVSILVQSTTVEAMFSGEGPSQSTPSTYPNYTHFLTLKEKKKHQSTVIFSNIEMLLSPCHQVWHKLDCGELCRPRLLGWLRLQRWAPPVRTKLLFAVVAYSPNDPRLHSRDFKTCGDHYQINEVCGHGAVWVSDRNALWSSYVFGCFP